MTTAKPISHEKVQEFLDEVSSLNLPKKYSDWYQVDVSTMLSNCQVVNHEIDTVSGDSLVFLKSSLLFCSYSIKASLSGINPYSTLKFSRKSISFLISSFVKLLSKVL